MLHGESKMEEARRGSSYKTLAARGNRSRDRIALRKCICSCSATRAAPYCSLYPPLAAVANVPPQGVPPPCEGAFLRFMEYRKQKRFTGGSHVCRTRITPLKMAFVIIDDCKNDTKIKNGIKKSVFLGNTANKSEKFG